MIQNFSNALKENARVGHVFALLFAIGIFISAFMLFSLPHQLVIQGGLAVSDMAWPVVTAPFVTVLATYVMAVAAIVALLHHRREIVVYIEKKKEDTSNDQSSVSGNGATMGDVNSFTASLKGSSDDENLQNGLNALCSQFNAGQGAIFRLNESEGKRSLELSCGYALSVGESSNQRFEWGEGLIGQVAATGKSVCLDEIPKGYINILSGLGDAAPRTIVMVPMKKEKKVIGVVEIATFELITDIELRLIEEMVNVLSEKTESIKVQVHV